MGGAAARGDREALSKQVYFTHSRRDKAWHATQRHGETPGWLEGREGRGAGRSLRWGFWGKGRAGPGR